MKSLRKYSILKSIGPIVQIQGFMNLNHQKDMKRLFFDIEESLRRRKDYRLIGTLFLEGWVIKGLLHVLFLFHLQKRLESKD